MEFVAIAAVLEAAPTPSASADDIVDYVRAQLDADYASVTVIRSRKRLETIAPTDRLAQQLDQMQYELREAPATTAPGTPGR